MKGTRILREWDFELIYPGLGKGKKEY